MIKPVEQPTHFSTLIDAYCEKHGISLREAGKRMQIDKSSLSRYRQGDAAISRRHLQNAKVAMGLTPEDVLKIVEEGGGMGGKSNRAALRDIYEVLGITHFHYDDLEMLLSIAKEVGSLELLVALKLVSGKQQSINSTVT